MKCASGLAKGIATLMAGALLLGCSNNNTSPEGAGDGLSDIRLQGSAAKGIIGLGTVVVQELDLAGEVIATVGETETDIDGSYSLLLSDSYGGGPLLVNVGNNEETAMRCDATTTCGQRQDSLGDNNTVVDFGEWYRPARYNLTALLPGAIDGEEIFATVTPFTHLAAQHVINQGLVDASAIATTNSTISNLLGGIDILNTPAIDVTDAYYRQRASATQVTYAILCAAIANMAQKEVVETTFNDDGTISDDSPTKIEQALNKLVGSFATGALPADDSNALDEVDDALYSMREIVDQAQIVFDYLELSDISGVMATLESEIATASDIDGDSIADIIPEPSVTAADNPLAKAKNLVEDVRTWAYLIDNDLSQAASAFDEQIKLAKASASFVSEDLLDEILIAAIDVAGRFDGTTDLSQYPLNHHWAWPNFTSGTITQSNDGESDIITISDGVFSAESNVVADGQELAVVKEFASVDMTLRLPPDGTSATSHRWQIVSAQVNSDYADVTINDSWVTLNFDQPYTLSASPMDLPTLALDASSYELDLDLSLTQKWDYDASYQASVADPYLTWVDVYYQDPITFEGRLKATLYPIIATDATTLERYIRWVTPSRLELTGVSSDTSGRRVEASLAANVANAETFTPVSDTQVEDADNWIEVDLSPDDLDLTLGISFSLQLEDLPEATIRVTGDRTGLAAGDVELTIDYDNQQLRINASGDANTDSITSEVTLTNQDGAILTFLPDSSPLSGTISYNGIVYGTVSETASGYLKIEYIDGTFEIF